MMSALLADGAEQQSGKPAVSARPDDQEVAIGASGDQDFRCTTLDGPPLDLDALSVQPGSRLLEQCLGRSVHVAGAGT
jgi:hypothetical protein